ncbi:MAG: glycosyltransferase family 4 protein [Gemmatimonadetes bacterium]|nr:glycosyltransferase family 4 protein [Gemmatimonadota bacterium]
MSPLISGVMRAAIVSHTYVEDQNRGKLEALARKGVHLAAFVPSVWQEGALGKRWTVTHERIGNLEIVPVPVRRTLGTPAAALWDLSELKERLARGEIDVVQVEEEPWSLAARLALRAARRHGVTSAIFTWQNIAGRPRWPLSILARKTLQLADGWIAGNEAGKQLLARVSQSHTHPHPLVVLPQLGVGVPEASSRPADEAGTLRIAFVGRLVEEKGVGDLIEAVAGLHSGWSLAVVGDGPARRKLEAQTRRLGVADRVSFRGAVPHAEVASLWPSIDVLALPSRTTPHWAEQFGHVLVEAMAHGVTVIGSSSGAIPEVIGDAGVVVPEGDEVALREALEQLATNRNTLRELAARGNERVRQLYTDDAIAERTIAFWKSLRCPES